MAFSIGDIVEIKSGGPRMTVTDPKDSMGRVAAMWFAGAKREVGSFPPDALKAVEDTKK
ncbi:DUF2158 domain-containing protein [Mesorhizobium sp.]|uniref:YodC family protein n=1 Tax=Mesorhizobium sp. TaxID=1871066 RepID=UPI000FE9D4BA|nr:DUF2158 domain-containing protein [Mesorhizobium sp.]RWK76264.1 MAG: DUF2158 domain-containing protein [Mesorhizobium sp.]RWK81021.1 MAG: DUF2158 domain-containing protein [Mesorhizobium sp.]RWL08342.1 MAG: DUF2158 domain-containing protein [Mesorhizobium sp.]RWL12141.1 MAG: DUF2158 domain-containing protein [Mesorhizobium sp.]